MGGDSLHGAVKVPGGPEAIFVCLRCIINSVSSFSIPQHLFMAGQDAGGALSSKMSPRIILRM